MRAGQWQTPVPATTSATSSRRPGARARRVGFWVERRAYRYAGFTAPGMRAASAPARRREIVGDKSGLFSGAVFGVSAIRTATAPSATAQRAGDGVDERFRRAGFGDERWQTRPASSIFLFNPAWRAGWLAGRELATETRRHGGGVKRRVVARHPGVCAFGRAPVGSRVAKGYVWTIDRRFARWGRSPLSRARTHVLFPRS